MRDIGPRDAERAGLVGLAYVPSSFDCMHLAVRAQAALWGRAVAWSPAAVHPVSAVDRAVMIKSHAGALARRLGDDEQPTSGHAVILYRGVHELHIGTVLKDSSGELWVLHTASDGVGSRVQLLRAITAEGLKVEGFYQWITS